MCGMCGSMFLVPAQNIDQVAFTCIFVHTTTPSACVNAEINI